MTTKFEMAFGSGQMSVSVSDKQVINIIEGKKINSLTNYQVAIRKVLEQPIGTSPFSSLFSTGDSVAIVVSDLTRAWLRYDLILPVLLDALNELGVADKDITLVVALGAHRQHSLADNVKVYGNAAVSRVSIIQSYAHKEADFSYIGTTTRGVEVALNKNVLRADKIIVTGGIVYHDMAGFGGGPKAILPGIAGYETIQQNHIFCLHPEPGKGLNYQCTRGCLSGNPMHEDLAEIAQMLNPTFLLNAVMTPDGNYSQFFAGHWLEAWQAGCKKVVEIYGVPITAKADLVIASAGGYPRDINMYQGAKTVANAFSACRDDGVVILLMECREINEPPDFSKWFYYPSLHQLEMKLREEFTVPGFTALKMLTRAAAVPHIVVTLPENKNAIEQMGMQAVTTLEEAMILANKRLNKRDYTINIMPQAAVTMPLV